MKPKSYLFLFFLGLILVFILGVRYGQQVEKTNKAINYFLSITPLPRRIPPIAGEGGPISPTPFKYATSESKIWKIKFTYPSFLKIKEDPTNSAILIEP